ncbi:MAG: protein translocase subunit SecD [Lachnospiraceae bacterium]|nr:protein translocase subunit SecD [Lachnospiraceae bacterium]
MNHKVKGLGKIVLTLVVLAAVLFVSLCGIGKNRKGSADGIRLGLDLAGGVSITYEAVKENPTDEEMKDTLYKLRKRVDDSGQTEADIYMEGENRINVDIPGATDAEATLKELGRMGELYFVLGTNNIQMVNYDEVTGEIEYAFLKSWEEIKEAGDIILDGTDIQTADAGWYSEYGRTENIVNLTLNDAGRVKFAKATTAHVGEEIAIVYDGEVVSAPTVQQPLTEGKAQISGNFTAEQASTLATTIRVGALPLELKELRSNVVGATLGAEAIKTSLFAAAIGVILVFIFMAIRYRLPGVAADLALAIYIGLMVICLNLLEITLTLPGLAGIILSIGMAVDANVIIFSRIQEEIGVGKTVKTSIKLGFSKAFSAIFDGNITTLIAAVVLYILGSGTVKGFATTLALGIILSMFTALFVTKFILNAFYDAGFDKEKHFGQVVEGKVRNFVKHGKKYALISGVLILVGVIGMVAGKVSSGEILAYGLDFKGGTAMTVTFPEGTEPTITDLEAAVQKSIGKSAVVNLVSDANAATIKTEELKEEQRNVLTSYLVENFGVTEDEIEMQSISGTVSGEMKKDAILAVAVATVCMLIYIWLRFSNLAFAASAVIALLHDVLIVLAVYAVSRISVGNTFIACMLTIVGYSINATIVVFDRIRENLKERLKKESYADIVNKSIAQTFSRNIYTSLTTFFMVAALVIFGVTSIREFALPLMAGIICGAYSSICITGLLWLKLREKFPEDEEE